MYNIIKSQNYQVRHDMLSVITMMIVMGITIYMTVQDGIFHMTGGERFLSLGNKLPLLWLFICLVMGARIAAWDFNDKTINYELLAGHSRKTMYGGRFVSAFVWCFILCSATLLVPVVVSTVTGGWGDYVNLQDCILRMLLAIPPMVRILAEFFLLAVILRNCYAAYAVGYVLLGTAMITVLMVNEFLDVNLVNVLGYTTLCNLLEVTNYHKEFVHGQDIYVYDATILLSDAVKILLSSCGGILVCFFGGYGIFKKRDMQ